SPSSMIKLYNIVVSVFFFFQAEDGIRDRNVTGVQTCALPICCGRKGSALADESRRDTTTTALEDLRDLGRRGSTIVMDDREPWRSEERRVGKEGGSRGWQDEERNQEKTDAAAETSGNTL